MIIVLKIGKFVHSVHIDGIGNSSDPSLTCQWNQCFIPRLNHRWRFHRLLGSAGCNLSILFIKKTPTNTEPMLTVKRRLQDSHNVYL